MGETRMSTFDEIKVTTAGTLRSQGALIVSVRPASCGTIEGEDGLHMRFEYQNAGFVVSLSELERAISEARAFRAALKFETR